MNPLEMSYRMASHFVLFTFLICVQYFFDTQASYEKMSSCKLKIVGTFQIRFTIYSQGPTVISWKKSDSSGLKYDYLATGNHLHSNDQRISLTEVNDQGSTLTIQMANETDVGEYVCEVSSNPPATLRHHVSLILPPSVEILKPNGLPYRVRNGEELALVCHGHGDPMPTIVWKREKKRMPDGRSSIEGNEVIYKNVNRKYSGTYICEGSNGSGLVVNDSITVDVLHSPEIVPEQSYIQQNEGVQLELVCIVHASPTPSVFWYRDGTRLTNDEDPSNRIRIGHIGRKHILSVASISADRDSGMYSCHAINDIGEAKENFQILTATETVESITNQRTGKQDQFEIEPEIQGEMADERTSSSMESSMNDWSSGQTTFSPTNVATNVAIAILSIFTTFLWH